jgi:hypothetical protein
MIRFLISRVADESRREAARVEGRRVRRLAPRIEGLEDRQLLNNFGIGITTGSGSGSGSHSYSPKSPPAHFV